MTTTTQDPERKKIEDERTWDEKNRLTVRQQVLACSLNKVPPLLPSSLPSRRLLPTAACYYCVVC